MSAKTGQAQLWCVVLYVAVENPQETERLVAIVGVPVLDFLEPYVPEVVAVAEEWAAVIAGLLDEWAAR